MYVIKQTMYVNMEKTMNKFTFYAETTNSVSLEVKAETIEEAERIAELSDGGDWESDPYAGSFDIIWDLTQEEEV